MMDAVGALLTLLPIRYARDVSFLIVACAVADAVFPQPKAGSAWVRPRRVVSALGCNWLQAVNRIRPGTPEATVTPADVLARVDHVAVKVSDLERRVP